MEAQQTVEKPRRKGDLNFEPAFFLEFMPIPTVPLSNRVGAEFILDLLRGVLVRKPWVASDGNADSFTLTVVEEWKSPASILRVECRNNYSVINGKHLDAYLRYAQHVAKAMFDHLADRGLRSVEQELMLYAFVRSFRKEKSN